MDDLGVYTPIFGNIHKATALGCNFDSKTSKASMWHIPHGLTGSDWTGNLWQSHCYCESQLFNADRSAAIKKQNGRHVFYYNCCCSLILTICSIWQRICCHGIRFFQLNNCTRLVGFLHLLASRPTGIANAADPPCLDSNGWWDWSSYQWTLCSWWHLRTQMPRWLHQIQFLWLKDQVKEVIISWFTGVFFSNDLCF